ncbi:permease [Thioclava sp. SK-1]|uniref:AEC family transporter n=1 Tax=Thioclava sp. SK-1 TaxID=1889770 RepID=UPI0008256B6F|nr:AEC family transporter [Thioclava sp. SK-1]OCX64561.1 permease [Thioclava sp. SK-1]
MASIWIAIAPTFLLIVLGFGLRRGGIPSVEFWNINDRIVYWVFMPALFFAKISAVDLHSAPLGDFAFILYAGLFGAIAFGWIMQKLCGYDPAQGTCVIQGASRFNTFVGLAIAGSLFGNEGLQIAVLGSALLVPVVNVSIVTLMASMLGGGQGGRVLATVKELLRNPLILSIAVGMVFNLLGWHEIPVLHETARVLGQGTLPVMLLCVGANLRLDGLDAAVGPVIWATVGKLLVFPALVFAAVYIVHPQEIVAQVAMIYAALPVAVSAYSLARQMRADAPLMAAMITAQTIAAFVTIPLTLALMAILYG